MTPRLHGRARELRAVLKLLDGAQTGAGGALVLVGEAGMGKTELLDVARQALIPDSTHILTTSGARAESQLAFAALHQLLLPVMPYLDKLVVPEQAALRVAFGLDNGGSPDLYQVALATLNLLGVAADAQPVVILVDDGHWLDVATADVLTFVGRRLCAEPIALLVAVRADSANRITDAGLDEVHLGPLDAAESEALLDENAIELDPSSRERVLRDSGGNPLALVELPRSLDQALDTASPVPDLLPLNARLERTFAARHQDLPPPTRLMLLLAACDQACDIDQLLHATRIVGGTPHTRQILLPAVRRELVTLHDRTLRFRHPLVASGIYQSAPMLDRLAAHAALAQVIVGEPDRRTWHRAAAAIGVDDEVSSELVELAGRSRRRGAVMVSVAALERASELASASRRRNDLALRAAEQASELGRRVTASAMMLKVDPTDLGTVGIGRRLSILEMTEPGDFGDGARIETLTDAARAVATADPELAIHLLWRATSRAWWGSVPYEQRQGIVSTTEGLDGDPEDIRRLAILAYAAPLERGAELLARLRAKPMPAPGDEAGHRFLASAALILGDPHLASRHWDEVELIQRRQGRMALLARGLMASSYGRLLTGDWAKVSTAAPEGHALAEETGEAFLSASGTGNQALYHAFRGDHVTAERLAREALENPLARSVRFVLFGCQQGLAAAVMAAGRHEEAYRLLRPCFDPSSPVNHRDMQMWIVDQLAEFAVQAEKVEDARKIIERLRPLAENSGQPRIRVSFLHADALLAAGPGTERAFADALGSDLQGWPVDEARLHLAYGRWLRRQRRLAEARDHLMSAQQLFAGLGPTAWDGRLDAEIQAAGLDLEESTRTARLDLTPQELRIASLAARGMSNREIGQHLFLSHRTVGSHLQHVYAKLGVAGRIGLDGALTRAGLEPQRPAASLR